MPLTAGRAEVVGLAIMLGGVPGSRLVDVHANGILRHRQILLGRAEKEVNKAEAPG
jgi:hypothetical protein